MTNLETSSTPEVKEKTQTQLMKEQIENTLDQVAQLAENGEWEIDTTVDTNVWVLVASRHRDVEINCPLTQKDKAEWVENVRMLVRQNQLKSLVWWRLVTDYELAEISMLKTIQWKTTESVVLYENWIDSLIQKKWFTAYSEETGVEKSLHTNTELKRFLLPVNLRMDDIKKKKIMQSEQKKKKILELGGDDQKDADAVLDQLD